MANLTDVFQLVACLPNVPDKKGFAAAVEESLTKLEQTEPGVRALYAGRLASRARHHKAMVDQIADRFRPVRAIDLRNVADENHLRDFHHCVYYAGFFVGRFVLVSNAFCDCSDHKLIDEQLRRVGSGLQFGAAAVDPSVRQERAKRAVELATKLGAWRRARTVADYTMSEQRLEEFAGQQELLSTRDELDDVFVAWSVP